MEKRDIPIRIAVIPVLFLIISLYYAVQIAKVDVHLPIFISAMFGALVARYGLGIKWNELEEGIVDTIKMTTGAIIILLIIGMVIGTWILSGVVPTMIYYGLKIINPSAFLGISVVICAIVSISTGSSWTTASTIGVALIGIGEGFGIDRNIIAGAIISGAYFGDKMSPLSDTTNLAPAVAGSTLFDHIKHMLYTTIPAFVIALTGFIIIGTRYKVENLDLSNIEKILTVLEGQFVISPWLLLIPVAVITIVVLKTPAIPGLFLGAIFGGIGAIVVQGKSVGDVLTALHNGYSGESGLQAVDELLNRGGMESMLWTVSLILCAMIFGGVMAKSGMLGAIAKLILKWAKSTGGLILATLITPIFINIVAGDQYLSIVIPGEMYKEEYKERGLAPKNLSRALEDSGTLTSALIPWNTCGATMIGALGVAPWAYVPYCFLNIISPIISAIYGFTGFTIEKIAKKDTDKGVKLQK